MSKKKTEATEFDLLNMFVAEMEHRGVNRKVIRMNIDAGLASAMSEKLNISVSVDRIERLADKCLANEWIERSVMDPGYVLLSLTSAGFGVVRSRQRKQEILDKRSILKKASDYIEDHKGLFVVIGVLIAVAGVLVRVYPK